MKLHKRIIREISLMGPETVITREILSTRLGVGAASIGGAVRKLADKGLLALSKEPSIGGKRSPQGLRLGKGAALVTVERAEGGFSVSLRGLDGALLQRKFIAEDVSLSFEGRVEAVASAVISYCGMIADTNGGFAFGVIEPNGLEAGVWRRVGADIISLEDILMTSNKRFGGTDIIVKIDSDEGISEVSVMRGGEIMNPRTAKSHGICSDNGLRLADLAALLDADNIFVFGESDLGLSDHDIVSDLRQRCAELGARARVIEVQRESKDLLICELLRDRLCDKLFK